MNILQIYEDFVSFVSVVLMKYHDEKQLIEEMFDFGLVFQRA